MASNITNVLNNTILPFDVRKADLLGGSLQLITVEVLVAKVIRKILNMGNRGVLELAFIHAVSLPMMGGFQAAFGAPRKYGMNHNYARLINNLTTQVTEAFIDAVNILKYLTIFHRI